MCRAEGREQSSGFSKARWQGWYWSMTLTAAVGETDAARKSRMAAEPARSSGRTRWRTSRPRTARPSTDFQVADLAVHLDDGGAVDLGVIRGGGELFGGAGVGVFHVGQIDVDEAVEEPQGFEVVVAAGVVNDGEHQPKAAGLDDGFGHRRGEMRGRHEVDVDAADPLEVEHDLDELIDGEVAAAAAVADVGILAKDAAEVAAGKKDRSGTARADQDGFFAEVRAGRTDAGGGADAAKAGLVVAAMRLAAAGTEDTGIDLGGQCVQGRLETVERGRVGMIDGFHGNPSPNRIRSFWRTLSQKRRKVKGNIHPGGRRLPRK